jgi:hypothetical protein
LSERANQNQDCFCNIFLIPIELVGGSIDWSVIREKEQPELKQVGKSIYVTDDDAPRLWAEYITSQSSNVIHYSSIDN